MAGNWVTRLFGPTKVTLDDEPERPALPPGRAAAGPQALARVPVDEPPPAPRAAPKAKASFAELPDQQEADVDHDGIDIALGTIDTPGTTIRLSIKIDAAGKGMLVLYMAELKGRRSGECALLGATAISEIRRLLDKAEGTVEKLSAAGQVKRFLP